MIAARAFRGDLTRAFRGDNADVTEPTLVRVPSRIAMIAFFVYATSWCASEPFSQLDQRYPDAFVWLSYTAPVLVAAICAYLAGRRLVATRMVLFRAWPIVSFASVALASAAWSMAPSFTIARSLVPIVTVVVGVTLLTHLDAQDRVDAIAAAAGFGIWVSVMLSWRLPQSWRAQNGDWIGWFGHKNNLGVAVVLAIPALVLALVRPWRGWGLARPALILPTLGACAVAQAGSGSKTSLVLLPLCAVILGALLLHRATRSWLRRTRLVAFGAGIVATAGVFVLLLRWFDSPEIRAIGADRTLTGRVHFWRALEPLIRWRWLQGYGLDNVWMGRNGYLDYAKRVAENNYDAGFFVHAHNGYIQTAVDFGLIGLVALLVLLFVCGRRAGQIARRGPTPASYWPIVTLTLIVLINVTSPMFIGPPNSAWLLLVLIGGWAVPPPCDEGVRRWYHRPWRSR